MTFDILFLVNFYADPPLITIISDQPSFAAHDEDTHGWFLVPLKRENKDLILQTVSNTGEIIDEFNFGQELQKKIKLDQNFFVNGIQLISNRDILVNFGVHKRVVNKRYIIDPVARTIKREVHL